MTEKMLELQLNNPNEAVSLLGMGDKNITLIEETYDVQVVTRGEVIQVAGENPDNKEQATLVLYSLLQVIRKKINIDIRDTTTASGSEQTAASTSRSRAYAIIASE